MKPIVIIVSPNNKFVRRAQVLANLLAADLINFPNAEKLEESGKGEAAALILVHTPESFMEQEIAAQVQVAKFCAAKAFLIVILGNRVAPETVNFTKKSGADAIIYEADFEDTSIPEFLASQKMNWEYIPIKAAELIPERKVTMTVYHLMPLNKRIVAMLNKDTLLSPDRFEKMKQIGEFYIARDDIQTYQKYIDENQDLSANGLLSRCRAKYLSLNVAYKNFVQLLFDQSQFSSFQEGKELLDNCFALAGDLITSLSSVGESWDVINNSSLKEITPIDRAPAIASIAGLVSLMCSVGKPEEVMVCALLADLGLLDMPPMTMNKFRTEGLSALTTEEKKSYERHPISSINRLLQRRIPLNDKLKAIISATHERADMKGFPNQPQKPHPLEAQLILFSEKVDIESKLEFGKERRDPAFVRNEIFQRESETSCFYQEFLNKIRHVCLPPKG